MPDITDTSDFCRSCGGTGGRYELTSRGTRLFEPCFACNGTGYRTVRVVSQAQASNATEDARSEHQ